ncbi:TrlF family AAA-like ATPase [Chryseobacterium sp. M5]|uniref:TrlF family AAA-like ATPase n=1 Tax=Chryseobacterium sp. M5 TaxID=3379128 RepID=UPI0038579DA4
MKINRGSEWRKWDLHVHTKGTNKNDQFTSSSIEIFFEFFFRKAIKNNIQAIGITDYFTIENYLKAKQYVSLIDNKFNESGEKLFSSSEIDFIRSIFIFPNIELRMMPSTGIEKLINIHCIFNPDYVTQLNNDFFNTIENQDRYKMNRAGFIEYGSSLKPHITDESQLFKEGINNFVIDPKSIKELIDKNSNFKNNTIIVVSNSSNDGNSGLQKHYDLFEGEQSSLDGVRKTIYNISNTIFSTNPKDIKYFLGKRLDDKVDVTQLEKDNEKEQVILERGSLKPCLVGSDAHTEAELFNRFTWIKSDLNFQGLKQIIYEPDQRVKIQDLEPDRKEEKLVIDGVKFICNDNKFTSEEIFFNRNLNVIIGGKSSGKSILLYNIAKTLLADRKILKNENPPHSYRYDFGNDLDFEVKILSGISQSIKRDDESPSILSEIKYIPQNYLSKLAEPENKKGNELLKLVRGLLLEDDDYKNKYQEFINRVKSNDINREFLINNYFEIQTKIESLKKDLILKGNEEVLELNIKGNNEKINKLKEGIGLTEAQIIQYNIYNEELEKIEIEIGKIRSDYSKINTFHTDAKNIVNDLIQKKEMVLNSLETSSIKEYFEVDFNIINQTLTSVESSIESIKLDSNRKFINENIFKQNFSEKSKRKIELDKLLKPFVQNQGIKKQITDIEKLVIEDKQKLSIINQFKKDIKSNEDALVNEKEKLFANYIGNFNEYKNIISELEERTKLLENDNLKIDGIPKFNYPKLKNKILEISDGRKASYNSFSIFNDDKNGTSNFDLDSFIVELKEIFNSMVEKKNYAFNTKSDIKNATKILLNDYFFDYWEVIYDNDTLTKMSTGKASFVILMLIVGLSKSKAPILIDQPEDNLDNRSITKDLVEYLRHKKLDRQVILVTHNPNVVVNADSENIIIANQKGQNDKITSSPFQFDYINGSIENTLPLNKNETDLLKSMGVREHIADIVEGGKEAFKKREEKYGF